MPSGDILTASGATPKIVNTALIKKSGCRTLRELKEMAVDGKEETPYDEYMAFQENDFLLLDEVVN